VAESLSGRGGPPRWSTWRCLTRRWRAGRPLRRSRSSCAPRGPRFFPAGLLNAASPRSSRRRGGRRSMPARAPCRPLRFCFGRCPVVRHPVVVLAFAAAGPCRRGRRRTARPWGDFLAADPALFTCAAATRRSHQPYRPLTHIRPCGSGLFPVRRRRPICSALAIPVVGQAQPTPQYGQTVSHRVRVSVRGGSGFVDRLVLHRAGRAGSHALASRYAGRGAHRVAQSKAMVVRIPFAAADHFVTLDVVACPDAPVATGCMRRGARPRLPGLTCSAPPAQPHCRPSSLAQPRTCRPREQVSFYHVVTSLGSRSRGGWRTTQLGQHPAAALRVPGTS